MSGTPHYKRTRLSGPHFTEMPDVPSSYENQAGKLPVVIAGENQLDFYSVEPGPGLAVTVDHANKRLVVSLVTLNAALGTAAGVGSAALAGSAPSLVVA